MAQTEAPRRVRTPEEVVLDREQALAEAREKFGLERPQLERRLADIRKEMDDLNGLLEHLKGPTMRQVLDNEHRLNSALSPVDSTDPNKAQEYEMWAKDLEENRGVMVQVKASLEERIKAKEDARLKLRIEQGDLEQRTQRGY